MSLQLIENISLINTNVTDADKYHPDKYPSLRILALAAQLAILIYV
jgi:hypothetical protein